jgi:hypothetical protein
MGSWPSPAGRSQTIDPHQQPRWIMELQPSRLKALSVSVVKAHALDTSSSGLATPTGSPLGNWPRHSRMHPMPSETTRSRSQQLHPDAKEACSSPSVRMHTNAHQSDHLYHPTFLHSRSSRRSPPSSTLAHSPHSAVMSSSHTNTLQHICIRNPYESIRIHMQHHPLPVTQSVISAASDHRPLRPHAAHSPTWPLHTHSTPTLISHSVHM